MTPRSLVPTRPALRSARPDLPASRPVRGLVAALLLRSALSRFPVRAVFPGGARLGRGDDNSPVMRVHRPAALYRRIAADGAIGFCEAYLAGDWSSADPAGVLTPFAARLNRPVNPALAALRRWTMPHRPAAEENTLSGARANVAAHYDLSDEMFATFLDPSMTYSSAWFAEGDDDLYGAQLRKIDAMLDYAGVGAGTRMLEIGSGWGSLALRAAERGAEVTTVTISRNQRDTVEELITAAGLDGRCRVRLADYREITGRYDAIVSVEMAEAVGAAHWPDYFGALARLLAPGGRIALQVITMPHDRMLATRDLATWIQRNVFPGGQVLSVPEVERQVAATSALRITARRSLGPHYARTLNQWRDRFLRAAPALEKLGFGADFRRMWEFYLAYAEAGFRAGYLNVWQFQLTDGEG